MAVSQPGGRSVGRGQLLVRPLAANDKAKLPWGCLDFRHTFGSQLAMKGESLYKISAIMGNSPEICRRHYAALIPEALCDSVEFESSVNATVSHPVQASA